VEPERRRASKIIIKIRDTYLYCSIGWNIILMIFTFNLSLTIPAHRTPQLHHMKNILAAFVCLLSFGWAFASTAPIQVHISLVVK